MKIHLRKIIKNINLMSNIKVPQFVLNAVVILFISAYGFIFTSVLDRVKVNEENIKDMNPTLLLIQTDIASINTNIEWLKTDKQKSK